MKLIVKVVLGVAAVPVIAIAGAFGYGVYMGVMGQPIEGPGQENESVPQEAPTPRAVPMNAASRFTPLPGELDAAGAEGWILENNLFWFDGESLIEDAELCAALDPGAAARVHHALRTGGKKSQPMRLHFFAICGNMPVNGRASFAKEVGAIYAPKRGASSRGTTASSPSCSFSKPTKRVRPTPGRCERTARCCRATRSSRLWPTSA